MSFTPNTSFPSGWTLYTRQNQTGVAASINVPGILGVVHVLDSVYAKIVSLSAAGGLETTELVVVNDIPVTFLDTMLVLPASQAGSDEASFDGLNISSIPGGGLTVKFLTPGGTGFWQEIVIQGHDV